MKFGLRFRNLQVQDWQEGYINYRLLKKMLKPFKLILKKSKQNDQGFDQIMIKLELWFEQLLYNEHQKMNLFFEYKLHEFTGIMKKIKLNQIIWSSFNEGQNELNKEEQLKYGQIIKQAFKMFYQDITMLQDFIDLNFEAMKRIIKKRNKFYKKLCIQHNHELQNNFKVLYLQSSCKMNYPNLQQIKNIIEKEYYKTFHNNNEKEGQRCLENIARSENLTQNQYFIFGILFGISMALTIILCYLCWIWEQDLFADELHYALPMLRGLGLIILQWIILGFCVFVSLLGGCGMISLFIVWTQRQINYKKILRFNSHYSHPSQIFSISIFFYMIWVLMFIWCLLSFEDISFLANFLDFMNFQYAPYGLLSVFLIYLLYPYGEIFNKQGRIYFLNQLKIILKFWKYDQSFSVIFVTDQFLSLGIPISDILHGICNSINIDQYYNKFHRTATLVLMIFIVFLRIMQCYHVYNNKNLNSQIYHIAKYVLTIFMMYFSFLINPNKPSFMQNQNEIYYYPWLAFLIPTVILYHYCDIKFNFGLLDQDSKEKFLRKNLIFKNKNIYYSLFIFNIFLRLSYCLSLSPQAIFYFDRYYVFILFIGFIEVFRRFLWNVVAIENQHINLFKFSKVEEKVYLPFENINMNILNSEIYKFQYQSIKALNIHSVQQFLSQNMEQQIENDLEINTSNNSSFTGIIQIDTFNQQEISLLSNSILHDEFGANKKQYWNISIFLIHMKQQIKLTFSYDNLLQLQQNLYIQVEYGETKKFSSRLLFVVLPIYYITYNIKIHYITYNINILYIILIYYIQYKYIIYNINILQIIKKYIQTYNRNNI